MHRTLSMMMVVSKDKWMVSGLRTIPVGSLKGEVWDINLLSISEAFELGCI